MDAKILCLGALARGPATGYEIRKMFEEGPYAAFAPIGYGSIYPALTQLHHDALVDCHAEEQSGRPDKKIYTLTARGRAVLVEALAGKAQPDRYKSDTLFMLSLAELLEPAQARRLIDDYRAHHACELERMRECDAATLSPGSQFVFGLGKAVYAAIATYIDGHADDLVAALEHPDRETLPGFDRDTTARPYREAGE